MLGQGSGLNNRLRKLFARIQREFQYPRVISVKCHIHANRKVWNDETPVVLRRVPPPPVILNPVPLDMDSETVQATLGVAACHRVQTLEEMSTDAHKVECWQQDNLYMHQPETAIQLPRCSPFPTRIPEPVAKKPSLKLPGFKLHRPTFRPKAIVRKNVGLAQTFPMCLTIHPLKTLPMKTQIRFRTSVLSSLGLKPAQVRFTGVVRNLPPIPLRLMAVESGLDVELAMARIVGSPNPMLGRRVWVIVYHLEKDRYLPITLKEE